MVHSSKSASIDRASKPSSCPTVRTVREYVVFRAFAGKRSLTATCRRLGKPPPVERRLSCFESPDNQSTTCTNMSSKTYTPNDSKPHQDEFESLLSEFEALRERVENLEEDRDELREQLADEREARREAEARVQELEDTVESEHEAQLDALETKAQSTRSMIAELQSRELEKGAHLSYDNVEANILDERLSVDGDRVERITKEDGDQYARLPGEEDTLERGGAVTQSTADLLPLQRLARYDDEMLANVTNRKPDELAAQAWRKRDDARKYGLWSKGSKDVRVYLTSSDLTDWIMTREKGVNKNYAQELARRTMDAMLELSKHRLTDKKRPGGRTVSRTRSDVSS